MSFINRSTFAEVMIKSQVLFFTHNVYIELYLSIIRCSIYILKDCRSAWPRSWL